MQRTGTTLLRAFGSAAGYAVASLLFAQAPFVLHDTTFLQRDTLGGEYHAVFLLSTAAQEALRAEDLLTLSPEGEAQVSVQLEELRSSLTVRCPAERPPVPEKWVPVYRLNGAHYTYAPCDNGYGGGVWLREGHAVQQTMEGPEVALLKVLQADGEGSCAMLWYTAYEPRGWNVSVRRVDPATGLALWTTDLERPVHQLMIPAEKAHLLPRIVNHCPNRKWAELPFEPVHPSQYP